MSIYNAAQGSTGTVKAGTTVSIGTSALLNEGDIGTVTAGDSAGTTVTVYNGGAEVGDISAKSGSISIVANKGQIGAVDSKLGNVAVGSSGKTQQNAGNAVGNEGRIESLTAVSYTHLALRSTSTSRRWRRSLAAAATAARRAVSLRARSSRRRRHWWRPSNAPTPPYDGDFTA